MKYVLDRIKGGLLPTLVIAFAILALNYISSIPAEWEWDRGLAALFDAKIPLGGFFINLFIVMAIVFFVGVLKYHGVLAVLVAKLRPTSSLARTIRPIFGAKEDQGFMFLVRGWTASGPAMGVVTTEFIDMVDGHRKYRVYYPSPPNILTGPPTVDWDAERFITKDEFVRMGFRSVDEAVFAGYFIIYSDLRQPEPEYGFEQLIVATTSLGRFSPPGEPSPKTPPQ
jgi:hypothetical protein